jgi:ribosomal small subunit protein bTHX
MGRGDAKTKKGKINRGSYGNSRPKTTATKAPVAPTTAA